ncbi:MAG: long-chain acyl-CoA synthetase [Rhodospirillaceae bacterium]|nr:MAG: long-chain acyl-CoA synthetase [Rhodospirillaceae bacterium]
MAVEVRTLQHLVEAVTRGGDAPCIISVNQDTVSTRTYAEVGLLALKTAAGLVAAGVAKGEPVVTIGPNAFELIVIRLALAAMGALCVPIDNAARTGEVQTLVRASGARRAFTSTAHLSAVRAALEDKDTDVWTLDGDGPVPGWRTLAAGGPVELPALVPEDPIVLMHTSGTTGAPKAFRLSHANILHNVLVLAEQGLIDGSDRVLTPLPLHHAYPFIVGVLFPLRCGAGIVLPEAVQGPEIVAALALGRATAMVGVPRLYEALIRGAESRVARYGGLARGLFGSLLAISIGVRRVTGWHVGRWLFAPLHRQLGPRLRFLACGGAHLAASSVWKLEGLGWACYPGYGLAETASIFTGNLPGRQRIGSEGLPLPGGQLRIANADRDGVGEVQLRGPGVFAGYDDAAVTRQAFEPDGWFRTGDLGHVDADGYLYVTGRLKEVMVLGGGKKVLPESIEAQLDKSPFFKEVAVLEFEGRIVALVQPDFARIAGAGHRRVDDVVRVTLSELAQALPLHERPAGFAVARAPLPRTRLGKLRRHLLHELYERARAGGSMSDDAGPALGSADEALLSRPAARAIWDWLGKQYPVRPLSLDLSPSLDLGIDSLEWIALSLKLQERFGVHLSEGRIAGISTLRDLITAAIEANGKPTPQEADAALSPEERYLAPARPWQRALGTLAYAVNRIVCCVFFRVEAKGLANIPDRGPYILVANHASDLDPLVLGACQSLRVLRHTWWSGVAERLFRTRAHAAVMRAGNVFPLDEQAPEASLALAVAILERGDALVWFPESWRSPDGRIQRFLPGIGAIVMRTGAPCVPVRISGTREAMPRGARVPRPRKVHVTFGMAMPASLLSEASRKEPNPRQAIADALRTAVMELGS